MPATPVTLRGRLGRRGRWPKPLPVGPAGTACAAPAIELHLRPNGEVGPCCRSSRPYGSIRERRLPELWADALRQEVVATLAAGRYPTGCERCATEAALTSRAAVYAAEYDAMAVRFGTTSETVWPARMEFNLSNRCNLQCRQCTGDLSSAIRIHREGRPPMPAAYGDQFFADLRAFVPHLQQATFAGGEPFLAPENYRVWDLVAELNPTLACSIITNGTQWNARVERVLDQLVVDPVVSIDGHTQPTFEAIRVGAAHATVLANLERFRAAAAAKGRPTCVNWCVTPQNLHELPDFLLFAEDRGVCVSALIVHGPVEMSLPQLPRADLRRLFARIEPRIDDLDARLDRNRQTWRTTIEQLQAWLGGDGDAAATTWTTNNPMILQFRRQGDGSSDDRPWRDRLSAEGFTTVHAVHIGPDERARGWSSELVAALALDPAIVEGSPISVVLGATDRYEVESEGPDHYSAHGMVGPAHLRVVLVPMRDETGWSDEVRALLAVRTT